LAAAIGTANLGTRVSASGQAVLTDPAGVAFTFNFGLAGVLDANGDVGGNVNFVFGQALAQVWGAAPGVTSIHLMGTVAAITVAAEGTMTLEGQWTEKDFARGGAVAFVEENVPFRIKVNPDLRHFTLQ